MNTPPPLPPPPPTTGMTPGQIVLMVLFSLSMLLVGWLVWRLVNLQDPPGGKG